MDSAKTNLVLIVDEVQQANTSEDGQNMMLALKAARDSINPRPDIAGHLIFIGTSSHRAQLSEMTVKRNQVYAGATSINFSVLDKGYVDFLLGRYKAEVEASRLPGADITMSAFKAIDHRPEELRRALAQVVRQEDDPEMTMPIIVQTLRSTVADGEIIKVEKLGTLALEIFGRFAGSDAPVSGLFSTVAAEDDSNAIGENGRAGASFLLLDFYLPN